MFAREQPFLNFMALVSDRLIFSPLFMPISEAIKLLYTGNSVVHFNEYQSETRYREFEKN